MHRRFRRLQKHVNFIFMNSWNLSVHSLLLFSRVEVHDD